ncbi:unnamed protein product [Parnassius apollo]|uniref:(apollo) hypothetical protein n=1 Tax=Parnassius apollo TaxID=110799 RepID=A0A8S3XYR5_PARAO|nr:unnamed protein product [Parnassius apollo]
MERVTCMLIMISGCLVVQGAAIASLSLVIAIYMKPEETFRARFRLIMRDMIESKVPASLSKKVHTFYKMYWHKQKAVCTTQLLPTFPPWLPSIVHTDIYFKATQREHFERVKRHYYLKKPEECKYKSSIRQFKRNLMMLKEARDENGDLLLARTDVMLDIAGCYIMRNVSFEIVFVIYIEAN